MLNTREYKKIIQVLRVEYLKVRIRFKFKLIKNQTQIESKLSVKFLIRL